MGRFKKDDFKIISCCLLLVASTAFTEQVFGQNATEVNCTDGIDNDGDMLVDCDDPDCFDTSVFIDSGQALGNSWSYDVSLGDVDGDGDLDAWVANFNQLNRVWLNEGGAQGGTPGTFIDSGQALGVSTGVSLGDVDGDGDLDAWVANSFANRVYLNEGGLQGGTPGNFIDSGQLLGNSASQGVSLGDVDGDGDLDAWVANDGEPNRVWLNEGDAQGGTPGNFIDSGQALGNSDSRSVSLGDVDGDGDLDAWVANFGPPNRVWLNVGGAQGGTPGSFIDSGQALGNSQSADVSLGDLDGDGDLDAWVANSANALPGESNRVWLNEGGAQGGIAGSFVDNGQVFVNSVSHGVSLGDVDGDGDLDAWVANWANQPNRVWLNEGGAQRGTPGTFIDSGQALGNSESFGVSLGDVDGDGDLDAWVANRVLQPNRVWLNELSCPASDDCTNATATGEAMGITVDTSNATLGATTLSCGNPSPDVWFAYTAGCTGTATFETTFGPNNSTILEVLDGCGGTVLACDDDGGTGLLSLINLSVTSGTTYFVRVSGWGFLAGVITLDISCIPDSEVCTDGIDNDSDMLVDCEDPDCIGDVDCPQFRRGDCNRDGTVDIGDAVTLLAFLFPSGPVTPFECEDACDGNDDETLDIADAIRVLSALFGSPTVPLGAPYPDCGADPTIGVLDCDQYSLCP